MKTIKKISVFFVALAMSSFVLSCSSDSDGGGGGSAASGTIKAKVDGKSFTSVKIATFATLSNGTILQIQGNTGGTSSQAIVLNLMGFEGVGTYKISGENLNLLAANASYVETEVNMSNPMESETKTWFAPYAEEELGEVKIAEYVEGDYVKGTFHFKAMKNDEEGNIKNITDGSFNVKFTNF